MFIRERTVGVSSYHLRVKENMTVYMDVHTPNKEIFDAYYYGYGKIVSQEEIDGTIFTIVNYGDDKYRAEYQAGRFLSGLYRAKVTEV